MCITVIRSFSYHDLCYISLCGSTCLCDRNAAARKHVRNCCGLAVTQLQCTCLCAVLLFSALRGLYAIFKIEYSVCITHISFNPFAHCHRYKLLPYCIQDVCICCPERIHLDTISLLQQSCASVCRDRPARKYITITYQTRAILLNNILIIRYINRNRFRHLPSGIGSPL